MKPEMKKDCMMICLLICLMIALSYCYAEYGLPSGAGNSWFGQLYIMCTYGFILYKAAVLIGDGSEKLLLIYGPGIVGGLLIPILGAVPDGAIVLVSGLGSAASVQCTVSTGVGTLAGSTIMLLTIPWSISLFLGCRDVDPITGCAASKPNNGRPKYEDGFQIFKSCVTTYSNTVSGAKIMILTCISYLIVLIPAIIEKNAPSETQIEDEHYPALVGFIVCAVAFFAYSIFQVIDSGRQTAVELKQTKLKFLKWNESVGRKIASTDVAIKMAFDKFDKDGNGTIDREELQSGFKLLGLEVSRTQIVKLMKESQQDDDVETLTEREFSDAIKKWSRTILKKQNTNYDVAIQLSTKHLVNLDDTKKQTVITVDDDDDDNDDNKQSGGSLGDKKDDKSPLMKKKRRSYQSVKDDEEEEQLMGGTGGGREDRNDRDKLEEDMWNELIMAKEMDEEEEEEEEEQFLHLSDFQLILRAVTQLVFGTFLCCIFSDPMVATIGEFSTTVGVSSFFVSFIVTPIASNAAEIYSSLIFARKKTKEGISMGFSALYGAACMNNTFVLCIFCALVFFRRLQWTFIAETLVILLTVIIVGINGMRETVTVYQGFIVISLFPLSLVLVALLDPLLDDVTKCGSS